MNLNSSSPHIICSLLCDIVFTFSVILYFVLYSLVLHVFKPSFMLDLVVLLLIKRAVININSVDVLSNSSPKGAYNKEKGVA